MNSHIIVEQAIGDSLGYTYLFGHSLNRTNITANGIDLFPIPKAGAFLVRLSPTGKIIWVKSFYNKDPFDEVNLLDYSGGSILRGKNDDVYVFTHKHSSGRFHVNNTQIFNFNQGLTGLIFHFDRNGNIIRMKNYPILENNLRRFTTYNTNSYDSLARAKWGPGGKMVIYGVLNPAQMSGNSIDGVTVPFNVNRVKSALLFFDTTNLNVTSIRPLYRNTPTGPVGIPIESFTVDDNGNYYASYSHQRTVVPQTSLTYPGDTVKIKTVICAFNTSGTLSWVKQAEGLQPKAMEVVSGQLKVAGSNYARHFFSSGLTIYSNQSPPLHSVNKLTMIGDTNSYAGVGAYGLGSYDLMVASFNPSNGSVLKLQHYGTGKDDESVVMTKGNGDQIWAAGTVGITFHNQPVADTTTTILTYKIAADNNCASTYRTLSPFLRLDLGDAGTNCIDSVIKIFWSSHAAGPVNLSFSLDNGNTYTTIASAVPVNTGVYNFNAAQAGAVGTVLFRIQDPANNLSDTARKLLVLRVTPEVTITASATTVCANTTVNFTATPANGGNAPSYQWFINNQTPSTNSPNWTWSSFTNGAQIKVIMTSNHVCRRTPTDTSNIITMTVSSSVTPAVSIAGNTTVTQGQSTPVTATPSNGGTAPVYQWQDSTAAHGWQNIPGATSSTYNYSPAATGDKIRCNVTSNASCVSQATVVSAALAFTVNAVTSVGPSPASEFGIQLYPNPSIASFTIDTLKLSHRWETLDVISMDGRHKLIHMNIINKQRVDVDIRKLSAAMYTVILRRKNGSPVYIKFVKQ